MNQYELQSKLQSSSKSYKCRFCSKTYKRHSCFKTHILVCEEIHKSKYLQEKEEEWEKDIPTMKDMYRLLQVFIQKNVELEHKVNELTKYVETKKKRINIIDWLNENVMLEKDYDTWISELNVTQEELEYVFTNGIVSGMSHILVSNLPCDTNHTHPIKCFTQKPHTFYCYKENSWKVMTTRDLDILFTKLDQRIFKQFIVWKDNNKRRIETDDNFYNNVYMVNMHRMLGGTRSASSAISSEERNNKNKKKMRSELYHYLQQSIKNIIQYDFTF